MGVDECLSAWWEGEATERAASKGVDAVAQDGKGGVQDAVGGGVEIRAARLGKDVSWRNVLVIIQDKKDWGRTVAVDEVIEVGLRDTASLVASVVAAITTPVTPTRGARCDGRCREDKRREDGSELHVCGCMSAVEKSKRLSIEEEMVRVRRGMFNYLLVSPDFRMLSVGRSRYQWPDVYSDDADMHAGNPEVRFCLL